MAVGGDAGALVEVNSETDFVARNDEFKAFVKRAAEVALEAGGDVEKLLGSQHNPGSANVKDTVTELVAKIGERLKTLGGYQSEKVECIVLEALGINGRLGAYLMEAAL